ncbi:DinB family protein [Salisediminibacterium selenitireducens]|uniref:DinB family protein n=1 Tax=Bacillus selenitireducens (strain ATCC 700615 / DSM 15326 / MLS10) TaxID=439292 RepID=D6Y0B1_BACIE|nr:DinB family protein [Salisediminibacterium selenitireducens]ADH98502.1 DinB family protein [[Bacillus] selenitireducens MLS10]
MYRKINDFRLDWLVSVDRTKKVIDTITDETMDQAIEDGHNTLGSLAWHLTQSAFGIGRMLEVPVKPPPVEEQPKTAEELLKHYHNTTESLELGILQHLKEDMLTDHVHFAGQDMNKGQLLRMIIDHQTHHVGQMTVLLRQAGLRVPGIMGPTKEDIAEQRAQSH